MRHHNNSVATWGMVLDVLPLLYYKFTAKYVLREFFKSLNTWQSCRENASNDLFAGAVSCWKMKNSHQTWRAATVVTALHYD